jgi:glycosyltransferase involved in cell wall biosynthesis
MRILFLAPQPFFQARGTPIAAKLLLEFLSEQGHTVDVLTYHEGEDVSIPGVRIHRTAALPGVRDIRPGFSWKKLACDALMLPKAVRMALRGRYDLVHAIEESVFIAAAIKAITGTPFLYDMDSSIAQQMLDQKPRLRPLGRLLQRFERFAVRRSLGVLAVCRSLELRAREHAPEKLVAVVEDPSLVSAVSAPESLRDLVPPGAPLVLYVGNLQPYQGIDLLLESFAAARARRPDAHLVLIGGPAEKVEHYRAMADGLGLGGSVHLPGERPLEFLGDYLRQADVLVSPRITGDNTPMKIYSYIDSGTPVLATRLPTHTQVLDDEIAALAEPTPAAFADALVALLDQPALGQDLAERAKERVEREYTREATLDKLGVFYGKVEGQMAKLALALPFVIV